MPVGCDPLKLLPLSAVALKAASSKALRSRLLAYHPEDIPLGRINFRRHWYHEPNSNIHKECVGEDVDCLVKAVQANLVSHMSIESLMQITLTLINTINPPASQAVTQPLAHAQVEDNVNYNILQRVASRFSLLSLCPKSL